MNSKTTETKEQYYALMSKRGNEQYEIVLPEPYMRMIVDLLNLRQDEMSGMYAMDSLEYIKHKYAIP